MAVRRKTYPCGHVGKGKFCHQCAQELIAAQKRKERKSAWADRLAAAPVPLDGIPRQVAEKVLGIVAELRSGTPYRHFKGKRLVGQRDVISIPVGWSYRLICRQRNGGLEVMEITTHEAYNNRLSSGGWAG